MGAVDTTRTILIGHSRGGEGVARLATLGPDGAAWRIRGLLLIAPTDFAFQPALGVATAVLLPTCDGDVSDLQGQLFVDTGRDAVPGDAALRSSVLVVGGSHNAFNTEWMPATATAPAFDDSACIDEPERISARTQRAIGATYAAALVHAALDGDLDAASLLDGSPVHAPSAGPAVVRSAALGGARSTVIRAGRTTPRATAGLTARPCATAARRSTPCLAASSPHFLQIENGGPLGQPGIALRWSRAGGSTTLPIAATPLPPGTTHVDLRAIVGPASPAVRVRASLLDATGAAHPLAPPAAASRQPGPGEGWTS